MSRRRSAAALLVVLLALLAGCRSGSDQPAQVRVAVGDQRLSLQPSQYCLDGTAQQYSTKPPVIVAAPDTKIVFTVPDAVARQGWAVQVFDQSLKQKLGVVHVDQGKAVFSRISTSDVVPPAFYLVVVEDKGSRCHLVSGAWPVGIIRAQNGGTGSAPTVSGGAMPPTAVPPTAAPSSGTPSTGAPSG